MKLNCFRAIQVKWIEGTSNKIPSRRKREGHFQQKKKKKWLRRIVDP